MTFGEKLTRLRKREGLSQEALAERLGVSRQAVSRWEQNTALPDAAHHWRERVLTLLYTAAQAVILLLTAEAGFGLAALVCHAGVYFLCVGVMTGRRPGRRKS